MLFKFAIGLLILLVGFPFAVFGSEMPGGLIIDVPIVALVLIALVIGLLYLHNQRVGIDDGRLFRVTAFGLRRKWPIDQLREIVRVRVRVGGLTFVVDSDLVIDLHGRAVASFTAFWEREELTALWTSVSLPVHEPWPESTNAREVRSRYPGAVPWLPTSIQSLTGR